jgi:hypothetical protein
MGNIMEEFLFIFLFGGIYFQIIGGILFLLLLLLPLTSGGSSTTTIKRFNV